MSEPTRDRPVVCLGMPGYTGLTPGAAAGFYGYPVTSNRREVRRLGVEGSLLAHNFNRLWCWALNTHRDRPVAYFAMQHADIEPEPGWLDTLIDELDATGLDVLGVPVAIKDERGVTSTALARDDGDTWRVHCRLTLAEVHALPATFTSADVGRPLLLNTGLWVCRFDPKWAERVWFTIRDRIAIDPDGKFVAVVEPEDWGFSRALHELGLAVGCTRKVRATHRGPQGFPNDRVWGNPFDREYLTEPAVPLPSDLTLTPAGAD